MSHYSVCDSEDGVVSRFARCLQVPEHHLRAGRDGCVGEGIGLPQNLQAVISRLSCPLSAILSQRRVSFPQAREQVRRSEREAAGSGCSQAVQARGV
jgi:hypothetical protein